MKFLFLSVQASTSGVPSNDASSGTSGDSDTVSDAKGKVKCKSEQTTNRTFWSNKT